MCRTTVLVAVALVLAGACSSSATVDRPTFAVTASSPPTAAVSVPVTTAGAGATSTSPPQPVPSTSTSNSTTPTPAAGTSATTTPAATTPLDERVIGTSVRGRPITAVRRGTPGGHVVVVIGVIHGDETAGSAITDRLQTDEVPAGLDLWIVPTMNPDGMAANDRHNADQVDLNRNFPFQWAPLGEPGSAEYAGASAASEPETRAVVGLLTEIQPELVIWYHQDLDRIAPGTGRDGRIRARYAQLTGVPLLDITGGTYTGVAATWARRTLPGTIAFIVELGPTLSGAQADNHAAAVLTVAGEL